mgnify:CR=1 FL=1
MANLMITNQCNLHCSYCFANEFVNKEKGIMSFENFIKCINFLSYNPSERIGLIGGEPTTHPDLKKMLSVIIDSPFKSACIFTNGILLDKFINELRNSRFQILINLNSPESIGQNDFDRIIHNMDEMINHHYMREQVGVGINLYDAEMNYEYLLEVLRKFNFKKVRVSVSVPNIEGKRKIDPIEYFHKMKNLVRKFIDDIVKINVSPNFDCNYLPKCIFSYEARDTLIRSNLSKPSICIPTVDILYDLQVVRCFGLSDLYKVHLLDFKNTDEIKRHFMMEIDALAYHIMPNKGCIGCHEYKAGLCSCGCYAYRLPELKKLREHVIEEYGK